MIHINSHDITGVYSGNKGIVSVYKGLQLVWTTVSKIIKSCYHNGYWNDEYPWTDDTPWTD